MSLAVCDLLLDHLVDGIGLAAKALVKHLALCDLVDETAHVQILGLVHIVAICNRPGCIQVTHLLPGLFKVVARHGAAVLKREHDFIGHDYRAQVS